MVVREEPEPVVEKCETCRFYKQVLQWEVGECRRRPPRVVDFDRDGEPCSPFPHLHRDEWCGEWEQKSREALE